MAEIPEIAPAHSASLIAAVADGEIFSGVSASQITT
jgi:hypothetical protein